MDEMEVLINGEPFEVNRHNTFLYTYLGELSVYTHVFVLTTEDEETWDGGYVFKDNPAFPVLASFVLEHNFVMHCNMGDVSECDLNAFNQSHYQDLYETNTVPEEWV